MALIRRLPFKIMLGRVSGALLTLSAAAAAADSFTNKVADSLKGDWGQIKLNINWRYQNVDQQGLKIANADMIRLRFGYQTPKISDFQAFAEFEGNTPIFLNQYNSLVNGKTQFPVIADPQAAELNQGWLSYAGIPETLVKAGRQKINYNNQRFVSEVPWRKLGQIYFPMNIGLK